MFKKGFFIALFLFLKLSTALADVYAVYGIHVDVVAKNATIAREQGLNDAQEKAFYKMLERLTLFKDMEALPVLTSEDILNLVQDFSVSNEKTSSVRYIADVDVQFNPQAIQTFFQEYQVPYVTFSAERSVVLPTYKETASSQPILWQDGNIWAKTLTQASKRSDLVPFVVPLGDLDDIALINESDLNSVDFLDLQPLQSKYQAKETLIMELVLFKEQNIVKAFIRPVQNKSAFITKELEITEPINGPMHEVFERAAQRIVYLLEQLWREKNAVRFDNPTQISVRIDIKNLGEWITFRKRLDKITLIKQYVVKALRRDLAEIEIFYAGTLDTFKETLKKDDLFLSETKDTGIFLLRDINDVPEEELRNLNTEENIETMEENISEATEEDLNSLQLGSDLMKDIMFNQSEIRTFSEGLYKIAEEEIEEETSVRNENNSEIPYFNSNSDLNTYQGE